jgi:Asp-tRNA(Asn)/Glu-tRNA(Gln) amidotransferase A subunit family amidase
MDRKTQCSQTHPARGVAATAGLARHDSALHAFITVTSERDVKTAREMEAEQRRGKWRGPPHGIPIDLKDNIDTAVIRTTAASELFKDRAPSEDAEVGQFETMDCAEGWFRPASASWALSRPAR